MYCPKCNKVYEDELTECPECGLSLSEGQPNTDDIVLEAMKPVLLTTSMNSVDTGIIMNLLQNNGIPSIKKDKFTGGYMNIYMGFSVFGQDIYVDEADYERAFDLISILKPEETSEEDSDSEDIYEANDYESLEPGAEENESSPTYPAFYKNPHIVARIILGFMAASAILAFVLNKLN